MRLMCKSSLPIPCKTTFPVPSGYLNRLLHVLLDDEDGGTNRS